MGSAEADSGVLGQLDAAQKLTGAAPVLVKCVKTPFYRGDACQRPVKEASAASWGRGPSTRPPPFPSVDEGFFGGNAVVRFQEKKSLMSRRLPRPPLPTPRAHLLSPPAASELS